MSTPYRTPIPEGQAVPAPTTGIYLGVGPNGPLTMRLFRQRGTRIVVFSGIYAAQLLALRAAVSGAAVGVISSNPAPWSALAQHAANVRLMSPATGVPRGTGPMLIVDDRPEQPRSLEEPSEWQCVIDVRTLRHDTAADSPASHLADLAQADVAVFDVLSREMAVTAGNVFGLGQDDAAALTVVPRHAVAVVSRGTVRLVRWDASAAENQVLRTALR